MIHEYVMKIYITLQNEKLDLFHKKKIKESDVKILYTD